MSPQGRAWVLLAAGSVLFVGSVAVLVLVPEAGAGFGWYAYSPMADEPPPDLMFPDPASRWLIAAGGAGLVAIGWAAGFLAGLRHR